MGDSKRTHCFMGHPLVEGNLRSSGSGGRQCKKCHTARVREQRRTMKALICTLAEAEVEQFEQLKAAARVLVGRTGGVPKGRKWPKEMA